MTRSPPTHADVLEALAASLGAGLSVGDACRVIARAGPASAQLARQIDDGARATPLPAVLASLGLIAEDAKAVLTFANTAGRLPAGLRWVAARAAARQRRGRALLGAIAGPLVFAALGLLLEPLPQLFLGGAFPWRSALRPTALLLGTTALAITLVWRYGSRVIAGVRTPGARVPFVGALFRLDAEADAAALIAEFADAEGLGAVQGAAPLVLAADWAQALAAIAADPTAPVTTMSETMALAIGAGQTARDLPSRFLAIARALEERLTARLRTTVRLAAFAVLAAIAVHGVQRLLATPLPGLNGDLGNLPLGNTPEMKELERELDNMLR